MKSFAVLALLAGFVASGALSPALAQPWGPPAPPPGPGWEHRQPPHHWRPRHRCWTEERRVRVDTPWGPRWRTREIRVCR